LFPIEFCNERNAIGESSGSRVGTAIVNDPGTSCSAKKKKNRQNTLRN
jgi:hypothetical protein